MKTAKEILTSHNKFHINLGLERISKIMNLLDNPQDKYKIIHVAGTNGKGSTSKIINEILYSHFKNNENIGLFTSPHLFNYEERIRVNNEEISSYLFNKLTNEIDKLAKKNDIELSEFELITAVAFYYFYLKKVKYVVLEVGLGGLFDSTNIIKDSISVITTIDFDHTERLGQTIEEIATQKAGIIKENSSVVVSKDNLGFSTIKKIALEKNAKLVDLKDVKVSFEKENYALIDGKKYLFNLLGSHQAKNLQLALGAIESLNLNISDETIKEALKNVQWRFRLEYLKDKNILIDSCHNPSGIKTLKDFLETNFSNEKKTIIFGCLKNKDYKTMLNLLKQTNSEIYFYNFDYPNSLKYDELEDKTNIKQLTSIEDIEKLIKEKKNLKIFCGSIYMLGRIFNEINLSSN